VPVLEELRQRKLVQWGLAYLAGAWVALQLVTILGDQFGWPASVQQGATILLAFGFFVALVVAWYHGEKGRQRVSGPELLMVAGILVVAGAAIALVRQEPAEPPDAGDEARASTGRGAAGTAVLEEGDTASVAPIAVSDRSVAVLPFDNLSPDTANAYFAHGVHDAVITALANLGDLTVTSRTSVMQYEETGEDVRTIAAELGVTHVVEGTVQRAGERVRATIQLIDARTDRHLWADHFEREVSPEALFAIQSEIAEEVAGALQASLTPEERRQVQRRPTDDLEAWELFTRARHIERTSEYSPELADRVFGMLRRATELDPEFALAHAELAEMYEGPWLETGEERWRDSIRAAAERALEIDPALPEGHLAMAGYHFATGEQAAERAAVQRALELRPNYAEALARLSRVEASSSRLDRAVCVARRAVEVDPTDAGVRIRLAHAYRDLGMYARAETSYGEGLDLCPQCEGLYGNLADMSLVQGDRRRALEHYRARRAVGDSTGEDFEDLAAIEWRLGWLDSAQVHFRRAAELGEERDWNQLRWAAVLLEGGAGDSAEAMLDEFEGRMRSDVESGRLEFIPELGLMAAHTIRGETDTAVEWLERAVDDGFHILPWLGDRTGPLGPMPGLDRLYRHDGYRRVEARLAPAVDSMRQIVERRGC
jgi:TolB-like protein/Tfp pilus assembly protein PilF